MSLHLEPRLKDADALYQKLILLLEGQEESMAMRTSARLILLLINHIGDQQVIEEAIMRASQSKEEQA